MNKYMSLVGYRAVTAVALAAAALMAAPASAQDAMNESSGPPASDPVENASGMDVSVSLSAATDYVWRGVSQSAEDPAVFAAISANYDGFYAGVGTENVDFAGINQEYDLWAGYVLQLGGGTALDVGVVRYGYVDSAADIDTLEVKAALSTSVSGTNLGLAAYWTPDYFGSSNDAVYTEVTASHALTEALSLSGAVGYQQISNTQDYLTWNAGVSYAVAPGARVDVRYHDTDSRAFGSLGSGRLVGSFSLAF